MTTTPNLLSPTPALTDEGTLESAIDCLTTNLPIDMSGGYTVRDLFEILVRTASRGESIEQTVRALNGTLVFHALFPLNIMLQFLSTAVERRFSVVTAIYLPALD
jgi:hypothetical protein